MPQKCTVCVHPEREAIDKALVAGETLRKVAERFGTTSATVNRHKVGHLPVTLTQAKKAAEVAHGDSLLDQVRELHARAVGLLDTAEAAGALQAATSAIREARGCLELMAKMMGELDAGAKVNVNVLNIDPGVLAGLRDSLAAKLADSGSPPVLLPAPESVHRAELPAAVIDLESKEG